VCLINRADVSTEDSLSFAADSPARVREGNGAGQPLAPHYMKAPPEHPGLAIARNFIEQDEPA
jgi:hypothetical protein